MKIVTLTTLFILFSLNVFSQITVGSDVTPEKAALLDIKTRTGTAGDTSSDGGGLLMPRVTISDASDLGIFSEITGLNDATEKLKHRGLTVYNIGTTSVEAGIYVWDGDKWQKAGVKKEIKFFYMPSIQIDLSQGDGSINLFNRYAAQFQNPKASSTGMPIPHYLNASDLDYYVTDYDTEVFDNVTVDATGKMEYELSDQLPADVCCSFINIVFVVK